MANGYNTTGMMVLNPDTAKKDDLLAVIESQQTDLEVVNKQLTTERRMPLPIDLTVAGGTAYATARADARAGAGGKLQAAVGAGLAVASAAFSETAPLVAGTMRAAAVGTAAGLAAVAGHEAGLKDAAEAERARLKQQDQQAAQQPGT